MPRDRSFEVLVYIGDSISSNIRILMFPDSQDGPPLGIE